MVSADFLRFVVTAHFFQCVRKTSPGTHTFFPSLPAAFTVERFRVAIGLCFNWQTYPHLRPYMRFLYVRPEFCPLGDLSTPKIRLSSDSASRRTPLPLANPSRYRADSGLSPYSTCAHRAHQLKAAVSIFGDGCSCIDVILGLWVVLFNGSILVVQTGRNPCKEWYKAAYSGFRYLLQILP